MSIEVVSILIIIILLPYLYYKNEMRNREKGDKEAEKAIDFYKKEYKPFNPDNRLPEVSRDGYELKDIALTATEMVYESPIPSEEDISLLVKGDFVKLKFIDKNGGIERMWVEYLEKEDGLHLGILRNDSFDDNELSYGKPVYFHSNHIFVIERS